MATTSLLSQIAQAVKRLLQLDRITGNKGFKLLESGIAYSGLNGYSIVCQEDCEFTTFDVNGIDRLSDYGLTGATVKAGAYLPVPEGSAITDIELTSGTCIIYNL
jgi:hypothetical protein